MSERKKCVVCNWPQPDHAVGCEAFACRGADLIKAERWRQMQEEHWSPAHDDEHGACELTMAASAYLYSVVGQVNGICWPDDIAENVPNSWPWDDVDFKPSPDPVRNLVKAGALLAAEIDRLQREQVPNG